jgi:hypothetical protein
MERLCCGPFIAAYAALGVCITLHRTQYVEQLLWIVLLVNTKDLQMLRDCPAKVERG